MVKTAREQGAPAASYDERTVRFLKTYEQFKPPQDHQLVICDCGGEGPRGYDDTPLFHPSIEYYGHGWDCGAYQFAANAIDCDLLVCFNAGAYFHGSDGWLYPLVSARREYGPGIYGVSASFERSAHLRTPCIAFDPAIMRDYPILVNDRERCNQFEASENSFTRWALHRDIPVLLMSWSGHPARTVNQWRDADFNGFRRGDQSDVLVWDRHTDLYRDANPSHKLELERYADGRR